MLNLPPAYYAPLPVAEGSAEEHTTGNDHTYDFSGNPQRIGDTTKHRFLQPFDIGTWTNGSRGGAMVAGLGANQVVTYDVDQTPDFWIVTLSSEGAANLRVYTGPGAGGPFYRIGANGKIKIPAQGQNYLTLSNVGVDIGYGTVVAVAGFTDIDVDYQAAGGGGGGIETADSLNVNGSVVAPLANGQIGGTINAPPAGLYEFTITTTLTGGAPAAADANNVYVQFSAGAPIIASVVPAVNVPTVTKVRKTLDGAHNIAANAVGNATAGVTYNVSIELRRIG